MRKIPSKYVQMVFMGFFMTGAIAYSEISSYPSSTWFDKLTMTPLIAAGGGLIGAIIALLIWAGERLRAYFFTSHGNTRHL
jgi:hypothetical protein